MLLTGLRIVGSCCCDEDDPADAARGESLSECTVPDASACCAASACRVDGCEAREVTGLNTFVIATARVERVGRKDAPVKESGTATPEEDEATEAEEEAEYSGTEKGGGDEAAPLLREKA